jgi:hypothetical protein
MYREIEGERERGRGREREGDSAQNGLTKRRKAPIDTAMSTTPVILQRQRQRHSDRE